MHITIIMVVTYILSCLRIGAAPWHYWQMNARYFSTEHGIFSKLSIDSLIPDRWRLPQSIDSETLTPSTFPVFFKPEWGQNAHGIHRVDDYEQLISLRAALSNEPQRYLVQQAATGKREYEIFSIDANRTDGTHDVMTVTEAVNEREQFPINSKNNHHTQYVDITSQFSPEAQTTLANFLSQIGEFGICRMSARADSNEELVAGNFHVIEINLFLPMPINLLDKSFSWAERWRFIRSSMMSLARATKMIKPVENPQPIFARMMLYGRNSSLPGQSATSKSTHKIGERYIQP
ncbi:hypothetical protein [Granulosicoccus antarcticus]|uniref:D-alanine--D-alanine ligase n=1 Tax=Granulosicoccus antarcticus IMCC3135 TaxID=1192854 RepID=A0A2Z2NMG5_9GAMM|nr:hypothetical protein [Granulosicoccus antarcticus]ASJ71715.1 D-alanine--D-alanine ligase [Granulosicoccus antarcticus IMCC3135]